jgi:hypothetical protein
MYAGGKERFSAPGKNLDIDHALQRWLSPVLHARSAAPKVGFVPGRAVTFRDSFLAALREKKLQIPTKALN